MSRKPTKKPSWILSPDLLFRPTIKSEVLMELISNQLDRGANPLLSIAYCIDEIMENHTTKNLEPILEALKIAFKTSLNDLYMLRLGYRYVVSSIILTLLCKDMPEKDRVPYVTSFFQYGEDEYINKIQTEIIRDLRATVNLYKLDISGACIFQFLAGYPIYENEYFVAGMEMATVLFSGLTQEVAQLRPNLNWPPPVEDFSIVN